MLGFLDSLHALFMSHVFRCCPCVFMNNLWSVRGLVPQIKNHVYVTLSTYIIVLLFFKNLNSYPLISHFAPSMGITSLFGDVLILYKLLAAN